MNTERLEERAESMRLSHEAHRPPPEGIPPPATFYPAWPAVEPVQSTE